tara:strand:- start:4664 stop:5425 length:762 start_codon:yes stop_codon:yes gene_type:complete
MAVVQYTTKFEPDGTGGTITKSVNSTAITDINANNELILMLVYENDFIEDGDKLHTPTTTGGFFNTDGGTVGSMENSTSSYRPLLTVTYTDGTSETHSADSSGNLDDTWYRTAGTTSQSDTVDDRNAEDAAFQLDTGAIFTVGNYAAFGSSYVARCSMRFGTNGSKTASSATLRLWFSANVTTGFARYEWHNRGVYVCKMSSDVSTSFGVEDWSHMQGWASSGTYAESDGEDEGGGEASGTDTGNSIFFGANF